MSQLISLGAINKLTCEYVYPKIANKKDNYICPECNKDLILCQGEIRVHHFRHKVDSINPCNHYSNPTETQIHKDAKILLKNLLERKFQISFIRNCCCCKKNEEFEIPEIGETSVIKIEYRFEYNGIKIADVAYIDDGELLCIFEICNTHKTCSENRPEPWFEINAETLIKIANDNTLTTLQLPCIRCEKCEDCVEKENVNLKSYNIQKYIRIKLGQKYPTPDYDENRRVIHLRFEFHAGDDTLNNKYLMELFKDDFINKKAVIHTWKGRGNVFIVSNFDYNKYNYWEYKCYDDCDINLPYEKNIDISGESTIDIIKEIIKYCETLNFIKCEKSKKIKESIHECNKSFVDVDINWDNKSQDNKLKALQRQLFFIDNDIEYIECGNNIYEIVNKVSNKIVKISSKNKAFVNGTWIDISLNDILKWYNNTDKNNMIDNDTKQKENVNNCATLKYVLTSKNKTQRKHILSKYLQSNNNGEITDLDEHYFTQIYHKFYLPKDEMPKFQIDEISKVLIETGEYGSKCFNILVDNKKYLISIKRFI
jgi:hypothetical protein